MTDISAETLKQLLRYEPETGKLFWKERSPDMFLSGTRSQSHQCALFNSKFAGKEAFTAVDRYGYKFGAIFGKNYRAHRVVWAITFGAWPDGQVDHINQNRNDNRIENLRLVSNAENQKNSKLRLTNTSGAAGVAWHKRSAKWQARITVDYKRLHLGYFDNKDDAIAARKAAEIKHGFHPNHGTACRP